MSRHWGEQSEKQTSDEPFTLQKGKQSQVKRIPCPVYCEADDHHCEESVEHRNLLQSLSPVVHSRTENDQEHDRQSDHPLEHGNHHRLPVLHLHGAP